MYMLDGIVNHWFFGQSWAVLPIVDAVQEFKVQSHNDKAEFGGVLGGVMNIVSKSGTNDLHAGGWWFVRNDAFDARNPFTDATVGRADAISAKPVWCHRRWPCNSQLGPSSSSGMRAGNSGAHSNRPTSIPPMRNLPGTFRTRYSGRQFTIQRQRWSIPPTRRISSGSLLPATGFRRTGSTR